MDPHRLLERNAASHPSYNDSLRRAAERAYENKGNCFCVYYDGEAMFVRTSEAAPPPNTVMVCIAQYWSDKTVQLRFRGARSEYINF